MAGNWWESAPLVEQEADFSDVKSGYSSTEYRPRLTPIQIATASYRGGKMPTSPEEEAAIQEAGDAGFGTALKGMGTLASMGVGGMSPQLAAFLARLGTGARTAQVLAGAGTGAAMSAPGAVKELVHGDVGGAAGTLATGAALGGGIGLVPGVGPWMAKLVKAGLAPQQAAQIAKTLAAEASAAAPAAAAEIAPAVTAATEVAAPAATAAAAPVASATRQLLQLAKESGAKVGQKVWFLIENGQPTKLLTPDQAAAATRAGLTATWAKVL